MNRPLVLFLCCFLLLPQPTRAQAPLDIVLEYTGISAWHAAGIQGAGVKIGIIDLGFAGIDRFAAGYTHETPLTNALTDHGALVYEVLLAAAPQAEFYLFQLNPGGRNIAEAVDWMIAQGVDVVNYSASTLDIPLDGTNYQAQQLGRLADADILTVVAMGNHGNSFLSEAFKDTDGDGWHEFDWGYEYLWAVPLLTEPFGEAHLRWQDTYTSALLDLDLYIYTENQQAILGASTAVQAGGAADWSYEDAFYPTQAGVPIHIRVRAKIPGAVPDGTLFYLYVDDSTLGATTPQGSLNAPADSPKVLAVGAIEANESVWARSSRGPTWDGRIKPDLVAPTRLQLMQHDQVFSGTSASTPLVSGAAALARGAFPQLSEAQVRQWLLNNAIDLGEPGADNTFGYGRLWLPAP